MDWKKIVFAIAICLIYIPMVFMAVTTFFPKTPVNECYVDYKYPIAAEGKELNQTQLDEYNRNMRECEISFESERTKYDGWKFIVIMIVNIIATLFMLMKLDKSIIFGLFFGVVITAFTATINYMESRSVIGFALLVFLFGLIIYFVNRLSKN
ncbi:hypothetical protein COY26_00040 [Candidatus Woesearchaeota archaeon CG_4_10_14_0_2_um_filter_33_10]|nr:MAG: hypothetical protein AUJ83_02390 [Candidatus Woesearchaeota archaeon CG1_02_33_12]PIN77662.1 MAG: hypothetical protein COV14_05295 [Candidatus Woesearchaeota archaeon CG10_big_fil_rev_8_21_14_0_10_33_12]PIU72380.1 MAG: hypothetical protein COS79_03165 [Candidatus Woesearchaeota archaeon CG06_land_8_20_14_3_00_33_13]PIZ54097.1 MAG: hypothetical protein COY26_00040 [Candidatus Woesearchaeota archaeon CG_4_10_14_0_2_um_filter_33_10]